MTSAVRPGGALITTFRNRGWLQSLYLIFGCAIAVQGIATAGYFLFVGEAEPGFFAVIMLLAAALVLFGLWFASQSLRRLRDPEPPITIGPMGLHDRAISLKPIPWQDIRDLRVWNGGRGGPVVGFELDDAAAERAAVRPRVKAAAAVNRPFGYGYRIHHMGTDANVERLVAAIAPYAEVRE